MEKEEKPSVQQKATHFYTNQKRQESERRAFFDQTGGGHQRIFQENTKNILHLGYVYAIGKSILVCIVNVKGGDSSTTSIIIHCYFPFIETYYLGLV